MSGGGRRPAVRHVDLSHEGTGDGLLVQEAGRVELEVKGLGIRGKLKAPSHGPISYSVAVMIFGLTVVGTLYGLAKVCASMNLIGPWAVTVMLGVPIIAAEAVIRVAYIWFRPTGTPTPFTFGRRTPGRHAARNR